MFAQKKASRNRTLALLLVLCIAVPLCTASAEAQSSWMWLTSGPTQVVYSIGEAFSAEGAQVTVRTLGGSTAVYDLPCDEVAVSQPDMMMAGKQVVTVAYGDASTGFVIYINTPQVETTDIPPSEAMEAPVPAEENESAEVQTIQPEAETITEIVEPVMDEADQNEVAYEDDSDKKVVRLTVKKEPEKTTYFVGETLDFAGGVLEVTYNDKSKAEIPFSRPGVEFDAETASKTGQMKVNVSYRGKKATVTVAVLDVGGVVTFVNSGITDDIIQRVARGMAVVEPDLPAVEGYTFAGWYEDESCTVPYAFGSSTITGDTSIYAYWKDNSHTYFGVTYDLNYYGVVPQSYFQTILGGEAARPVAEPVRDEFAFNGWFTDEACTSAYSGEAIASDTTLYAGWTRTTSGSQTYVFEAENVDMNGQTGPGMSNEAGGSDMVISEADKNPSGGRFLSFLYKQGITVSFHITSDEEDTNAQIAFSLAAELPNINLDPSNYVITVNGQSMNYAPVSIVNGENFAEHIVLTGVTLQKGHNEIVMITNNSVNPAGGGTYAGTAPIVDCIRITTTSVLAWDGVHGLPKDNN